MLTVILGCSQKQIPIEPKIQTDCGFISKISNIELRNAPHDPFQINSNNLTGDCLEIEVRYGGGCGGADFNLIASEDVTSSIPPQRSVVISLKDQDQCEAIVVKTISFDLTPFQVGNSREVLLIVENLDSPILYK